MNMVGLASNVHGLFAQAVLRVFTGAPSEAPPVPAEEVSLAPLPIADMEFGVGPDLSGEVAAEGAPLSIFKEEHPAQMKQCRDWILSGTMHLDLNIFAKVNRSLSRMMKAELQIGTRVYELEQRESLRTSGKRSYPVLCAHRCEAESRFRAEMHALVFDDDWRLCMSGPVDEVVQLQAYKLCSRASSLCYLLCVVLLRWFPYLAFAGVEDPTKLDFLQRVRSCMCDAYAESLKSFYGNSLWRHMCG